MIAPVQFIDKNADPVTLNAYNDDDHGFLRVDLTATTFTGGYYQVPDHKTPTAKARNRSTSSNTPGPPGAVRTQHPH